MARSIARIQTDLGRPDAAADAYAEAIPLFEAAFGPRHPQTVYTLVEYGQALWRSGRRDDLPAHVQRVGALVAEQLGAQSLPMSDILPQRALLATRGGPDSPGFAEGLALQAEVVALRESLLSPTASPTGRARLDHAAMLADSTDPKQLRRAWEELKLASEAGAGSRAFAYDLLVSLRDSGGMALDGVDKLAHAAHLPASDQRGRDRRGGAAIRAQGERAARADEERSGGLRSSRQGGYRIHEPSARRASDPRSR